VILVGQNKVKDKAWLSQPENVLPGEKAVFAGGSRKQENLIF
jgi:hypothetical protein